MQKNMVTKVVATMAVVTTAAFGVFYSISTNQKASADETMSVASTNENIENVENTNVVAELNIAAENMNATISGTPVVAETTADGNATRLPSESQPKIYLTDESGNEITDPSSQLSLGKDFYIVYEQGGATTKYDDGFSAFSMEITNPAKVVTGASIDGTPSVYCETVELTDSDITANTLSSNDTFTFTFTDNYLKNSDSTSDLYTGKIYKIKIPMHVASSLSGSDALPQYGTSPSGLVKFNLSGMTKTDSAQVSDAIGYSETRDQEYKKDVIIALPALYVARFDTTPAEQQIYGDVQYTLKVTNTVAGTEAQNVTIVESDDSGLASLGVNPEDIVVKKNGIEITTGKRLDNGKITISGLKIADSDTVEVTYRVKAGTEDMKNDKSRLQSLINKDVSNQSGKRTTTVTASNAYDTATATTSFNLLVPSVSKTQTQTKTAITSGETSHITLKYTVGGESNAQLVNPVLSITHAATPAYGTISNVKINGVAQSSYTSMSLGNVSYGDVVTLEYDVTAPTGYAASMNTAGAPTTATLTADNLVSPITHTSPLSISIPKMKNEVSVSNTTPSAEDETATTHPVTVTATVSEDDANAVATGVRITITDKAETDEPLTERFANLKVNGVSAEYTVSTTDPNTIYIDYGTIAKKSSVVVTYDDMIKSGSEPNGLKDNITVKIEAIPDPDVACNLPDGDDGQPVATSHFTVAAPELFVAAKVTDPIIEADPEAGIEETPQTINVSDVVTYSTDFYETTKIAKGRDFTLTLDIEDIVVASASSASTSADELKVSASSIYTPAQVGVKFTDTDEIKILDRSKDDVDVTDQYTVTLDDDGDTATISGKATTDLNTDDLYVVYKVKAGNNTAKSFEMLAGHEISVASTLEVSNLDDVAKSTATIQISDAALDVTKEAKDKEIGVGDTEEYTLTIQNDVDDQFTDYSKARNLVISDDLDEATAKFGYRIDEDSIKVELNGKDITKDSDVVVLVSDDDSGFDIKFNGDLSKKQKLVITYDATTTNIAEGAYSQSLLNSVRVVCDNSVPAYATATVEYDGEALPDEPMMESGSINEASSENTAAISSTGDTRLYIIAGVIAVAVIGGAVVIVVRRRNR